MAARAWGLCTEDSTEAVADIAPKQNESRQSPICMKPRCPSRRSPVTSLGLTLYSANVPCMLNMERKPHLVDEGEGLIPGTQVIGGSAAHFGSAGSREQARHRQQPRTALLQAPPKRQLQISLNVSYSVRVIHRRSRCAQGFLCHGAQSWKITIQNKAIYRCNLGQFSQPGRIKLNYPAEGSQFKFDCNALVPTSLDGEECSMEKEG